MPIKQGTTPTHKITTDVDLTDAKEIYVTYNQNSYNVVEKKSEDFDELTSEYLALRLTQDETLRFNDRGKITIQVRAVFADGTALVSNVMETTPYKLLKKGVI